MKWNEYFLTLDSSKQEILLRIINSALTFEPNAQKEMPYGVPGLKMNGKNLIAVAAHKNHYGIYPFSPEVINKLKKQFDGLETAKGTIRFSYDDFPEEQLIASIIKERKKEITLI